MLHLHRADRAERLIDQLAGVIAEPPPDADPFTPELVSVPSRGIERWLAQELSQRLGVSPDRRDGVCANVVFPFPATVIDWALTGATGGVVDVHQRQQTMDPWAPPRLTWTLLRVVDEVDGLGAFGAHLAGEHGRARRLAALRHVADLFDRYAVHRPGMIRAWHQEQDVNGAGDALPATARWQPRLWRAARELAGPSFAERVADLSSGGPVEPIPGLPARLALYGLTAMPASYLEVLDVLAQVHDVHVLLLHPSPGLWRRLEAQLDGTIGRPLRTDDPTADLPEHPLVTSWGRDSREMQVVLDGRGAAEVGSPPQLALDVTPTDRPLYGALLGVVQDHIRQDSAPPGAPVGPAPDRRLPLEATSLAGAGAPRRAVDTSLQVHACHGRLRQVEVVRDVVLGLMSDDPTLQPRDIVVMCPDVESFAPLVDAVFGADARLATVDPASPGDPTDEDPVASTDADRLPDVRVRLADRALRQVNPVLRTVADLLFLPDSRAEATALLDLAQREPVRTRFGFDSGELETIEHWVDELRVKWGLDADHRAAHGLTGSTNTWRAALDRLLLGVALPEGGPRMTGDVLPYDEAEGTTVELAGRFAELVARVQAVCDRLAESRPVAAWCDDLRWAASLLTATGHDEAWQTVQLDRLLDDLREQAGGDDAPEVAVTLPEIRDLLDDALRGRPTRANHRTGDLTVCTLVPMRSVPYRVVCLLGMDDETFPRRTVPSGDDLIARQPMVGDRDARTEDRQLLLDALLAAREHLVITYRARDERTNAPVPPAVPIAELLDALDATARPEDGPGRARDLIVRDHPLRASDPRAFDPADPFGFDPVARDAAEAGLGEPRPAPRFLDGLPAAAPAPTTVEWSDFRRFLGDPVQGYLRARLGVTLRSDDDPRTDDLPVELGGLEEWGVGTRLLRGELEGELDAWRRAELARGTVPPGGIGEAHLRRILESVLAIGEQARAVTGGEVFGQETGPVEVDLRVGDLHIVGAVEDVGSEALVSVDYGRIKAKRTLRLWLDWLALQGAGRGRRALAVTRPERDTKKRLVELTQLPAHLESAAVQQRLETLAELYLRGHEEPLPIFPDCSGVLARRLRETERRTAEKAAAKAWINRRWDGGEYGDGLAPEVVLIFGRLSFEELCELGPTEFEQGDGWDDTETSRFTRLALRLWNPVLDDVAAGGAT